MKRISGIALKSCVSIFFIFLVLRKINFFELGGIFKNVSIPALIWMFTVNYAITFFIALRWYFILDEFKEKISFFNVWKLSLIGLYFNILLPTGTGGDAVKILYITRNHQEKLRLGTSVIFDRFIGSSTIIAMAIISLLSYEKNLPAKLKITLALLLIVVLSIWLLIFWDRLAVLTGRIFPYRLRQKLKIFYNHLRDYGINSRVLINAICTSIFVQILSIYVQYLAAELVSPVSGTSIPFQLFFIFIPIIWLSSIVPSLGGLGIREYGYLFFFNPYLGKDAAIAMSLINLMLILAQAIAGGLIFLFFRPDRQNPQRKSF
ncbi:MAG: flippase-like domain-containing protein [Candidatus Omnitrophica bacterium]|nr:flippase-like domain-containing protein [Candidatus Omnitrophota bacterium]MCM8827715.1 flippase-like domain-containing protein [Candidatus Omnitrophota bacterium]